MWLVALVFVALLMWFGLRRSTELSVFELSRDGARLVRGSGPPGRLWGVAETERRAALPPRVARVVTEGGTPRLIAPADLPEGVVQQLRNVVGRHHVAHFRGGRGA